MYSYDASPFSIFENERPRRARSPKIENEDRFGSLSRVHMLRNWLHAVASRVLYVAEDMLERYRSFRRAPGGGRREPERRRTSVAGVRQGRTACG